MLSKRTRQNLSAVALVASVAVGLSVAVVSAHSEAQAASSKPHVPSMERTLELPRCSERTGKYDGTCFYDSKHQDAVINFNHGQWTYDMDTQDMIHNLYKGK